MTILHISTDFPDAFDGAKTPAIQNLVEATVDSFDHYVYSLNRIDVSPLALERAERRMRPDDRVTLLQGAATYRDDRLRGFDAAALVEVIEHIDPPRLPAVADAVFGHARPRRVVLTTPNAEHNVRFETLPAGKMRHGDHRFEWTRAELRAWCDAVAAEHGYEVAYEPVGDDDPEVGPPTQMAIFDLAGGPA